jgi:putative transposase
VIYRDVADYETFAFMLRRTAHRFSWRMRAFCLMPTHYHVVLDTPLEQLSAGMHRLNGCYAMQFNRRHRRSGHLFQSRFSVRVIEDEEYLERVSAYVIWNPVRAGHCEEPKDWPWTWSSHGSLEEL